MALHSFPSRPFEPVRRPRLLERFAHAAQYRLTLVVAPAGFGKSIAIRQFLAETAHDVIAFDASDDRTLLAFARGLGRAIAPLVTRVDVVARLAATVDQSPSDDELPRLLAASLLECLDGDKVIVAIDGLGASLLADAAVRHFVAALIERSPETLHWIVAVRNASALPVASWMAYDLAGEPIGEAELRFTLDEARSLAASGTNPVADVDELHAVTHGWPTAFALALRGGLHAEQLRNVASSRHRVFDFLAEQIFAEIPERERGFLLATCVLPSIDVEIATSLEGEGARELIERVRQHVPLIAAESETVFRCQPLFRTFLEYQLRRQREGALEAALVRAADALERIGRTADALQLAVRGGAAEHVERLLEAVGFDLLERGEGETLRAAVAVLVQHGRLGSPVVTSLRASIDAHDGELPRAIAQFQRSIEGARNPLETVRLTYRLALELTKRNDPGYRGLLEKTLPVLERATGIAAEALPADLEASVCGTLALAHLMLGDRDDARRWIRRALEIVEPLENVELRASIYHQASYVALVDGDIPRSTKLSLAATRVAVENRLFSLAARTYSVRYGIMMGVEDAPAKAMECLEGMLTCAESAGDRYLQIQALSAATDIAAQRGDEAEIVRLESEIARRDQGLVVQSTSLLPAMALRAAWRGDFQTASDLLAETAVEQPSVLRQAVRWSEIALYAAGAGQRELAVTATANALRVARSAEQLRAEDRRRYAVSLAWCALAEVVIGHTASANNLLLELERSRREFSARTRALVEAVRAIYLEAEIGSREPAAKALGALRTLDYGGYAKLFEVLPVARGQARSSIALLTKAEIQVLRALARGGSSTKVAAELDRSVNTVNVHVKSIMKKLGCTTRYDALAVAREHGLIA